MFTFHILVRQIRKIKNSTLLGVTAHDLQANQVFISIFGVGNFAVRFPYFVLNKTETIKRSHWVHQDITHNNVKRSLFRSTSTSRHEMEYLLRLICFDVWQLNSGTM